MKRLAELYEMGDITRDVYEKKKADLLVERDRLEVAPVTASLAIQRQRIQTLVDDWPKMTGDERKRMLALIFMEIRADHIDGKRLSVTFSRGRTGNPTSTPCSRGRRLQSRPALFQHRSGRRGSSTRKW